ncbi:glycosyltransferase [Rhodocista pekingensis]|uniref:Glycosyltransferase n=1 Tax=Rhodocista pekingensis TaxID=201185 RepID=A0ABW2KY63_9PROT
MRLHVLLHEAFGGVGGIAEVNRLLLAALARHPGIGEIVVLPRRVPPPEAPVPERVRHRPVRGSSAAAYLGAVLREALTAPRSDLILCGHVNLLPAAALLRRGRRIPTALMAHGVDVWQPTGRWPVDGLVRRVDHAVAVSAFTARRLQAWAGLADGRLHVLPNALDLSRFAPGPPRPELLDRYGLRGRTVLMTLARLSALERYKGIDELLDLLPALLRDRPDLAYLIVGDGDDRSRLEGKARGLGLGDRVVFTGFVPEAAKADHYRLADLFVLCGSGEGFGLVLVEAMACGLPVVASRLDGSQEVVADGMPGELADPRSPADLRRAVLAGLTRPKGAVPRALERFGFPAYTARVHALLDVLLDARAPDGPTGPGGLP